MNPDDNPFTAFPYTDNEQKNPNELTFYLWVSHGGNVSSNNNYYPIKTKFLSVSFYSQPYKSIDDSLLTLIINEGTKESKYICDLVNGNCPQIPIIKNGISRFVYLPPILFSGDNTSPNKHKQYMGLYRFIIIKTNKDFDSTRNAAQFIDYFHICRILSVEKLVTNSQLIQKPYYTYSHIFNVIENDCKKNNINPNNVSVGIYSCQDTIINYLKDYPIQSDIKQMIPKEGTIISHKSIILNSINEMQNNESASICFIQLLAPLKIDSNLNVNWSALGTIQYQGCALNVLSYYDILPQGRAREQVACLNITGTDIFTLIDYINDNYFKKYAPERENKFFVLRFPFKYGIRTIIDYMVDFNKKVNYNYTIIFKAYKDNLYNSKFSEVGHTVSITSYNKHIIYIDPQTSKSLLIPLTDHLTVLKQIKNIREMKDKNYIDIIFITGIETILNSLNIPNTSKIYINNWIVNGGIQFRSRPEIISGGKNNKGKQNNKNKKKKYITNKNINRKKYNKTLKIHKNKKGGNKNDDEFVKIMLEIDKKDNIPTTLIRNELCEL